MTTGLQFQKKIIEQLTFDEGDNPADCPAFLAMVNGLYATEATVEEATEIVFKINAGAIPSHHHLSQYVLKVTHRYYGMYGFDDPPGEPGSKQEVLVPDEEFCLTNFIIALFFREIPAEKAAQLIHSFHFSPTLDKREQ